MNHFWLIIKRMVGIPLAYYQERRVGIPLTGITPPHCCTCPKPGPGFLTSHIVVFLCLVKSREVCFVDIGGIIDQHCLEVIVCFVDIGGTVDHHCLEVIVCFADIGGTVDHHCLEVIVCFVDIGVDHHCLYFLFITLSYTRR